jgi:hypothetical protein
MLKQFYEAVLPRSGHYCLFLLGPKQHVWADSIGGLVEQTEARHNQQGVYFAVESFSIPESRTQANVLALRSLRLDIDAGEKKFARSPEGAYPTQREALKAALAFFGTTGIAPTYIVSSGEGLHIYYCMDNDMSPAQWSPLATRLGELGAEHGLRIDTTCTTDTARILRPVGALHPNGERVRVLKNTGVIHSYPDLRAALGAKEPAITRRFDGPSVNDDVIGSVEGPPKSAAKIVAHCPAMAEVAAAKGDVAEPLWRAMLGIVKFTVEGADAAHEMSCGYEGYDSDETERKLEAWAVGPTSCAEFAKHTSACVSCEHRGKIKSPIVLGYMTAPQIAELPPEKQPPPPVLAEPTGDPWDGSLPEGFTVKRAETGFTMTYAMQAEKESETGEMVPIVVQVPMTHDVFWLGQWAEASGTDDTAQVTLHAWDNKDRKVNTYLMDQTLAANRFKLLEWLAGKAIHLTKHKKAGQAVDDYIRASLQRIKNLSKRPKITERFGLRILPNGELVCAHGKYVIYPDGRIQEGMLGESLRETSALFPMPLAESQNGEWGPEVWPSINAKAKQYATFMRESYGAAGLEKYQLAAMLCLASPLMAFVTGAYHSGAKLPPNGLTVSLYSREGGRGKSALAQAIMSAYGYGSELAKDSNSTGSTDLARIAKLSLWGTMPMSMEEMGNTKEASITNLISAVANGAGRERATQKGGFTSSAQWSLINLITTNRAQRDMVAATQAESAAIQYRLIELNVDSINFDSDAVKRYGQQWSEVQRDCSGAMGAVIHHMLCKIGVERLNAMVMAKVAEASELLGAKQDARFQYRALGATLFLQLILEKVGLAMFDKDTLVEEFKAAHGSGLTYISENILPTDGVELMQLALSDLKANTLITETETHRGLDPSRYDMPLNVRIPDKVYARHVTMLGCTYVASNALREWCIEHKVSERDMLADCKKAGVITQPNKHRLTRFTAPIDLFKGTREEQTAISQCFKIDIRKLAHLTGADWDTPASTANVAPITRKQEAGSAGPASTPKESEA